MSIDSLPLDQRIGNALQVYVAYLQQMLWPDNLAVYYPKPALIFGIGALGALLILAVITFATVRVAKTAPYAVVCWFCYLGILVPVIGIVQVGSQAQADRYTYLPSIFISILVVWGLSVFVRGKASRVTGLCVAGAVITMLMLATRRQVVIWQNTETLFTHAARVTRDNPVALATLADIDLSRGRVAEATATVERILKIAPGFPRAECLKAAILQRQGRMQEAIPHLERSTGPEVFVAGRARLVLSLIDVGRLPEAEAVLNQVLQMMPNNPDAWLMKAALLREQGHTAEAVELFKKITAAYSPKLQDTPLLNYEIAELFSLTGQNKKAVEFYARAIADFPDFINALNNFAWLLATDLVAEMRNGKLAVQYAERACELAQWKQPVFMGTLAAAYAEADRFDDAVKMAERARDKAKATGNNAVANRNAELLELYRQGKPFREVSN